MTKREELLSEATEILIDFEEILVPKFPDYRKSWRHENILKTIIDLRHDRLTKCHDFYGCYPCVGEELMGTGLIKKTSDLRSKIEAYLKEKAA